MKTQLEANTNLWSKIKSAFTKKNYYETSDGTKIATDKGNGTIVVEDNNIEIRNLQNADIKAGNSGTSISVFDSTVDNYEDGKGDDNIVFSNSEVNKLNMTNCGDDTAEILDDTYVKNSYTHYAVDDFRQDSTSVCEHLKYKNIKDGFFYYFKSESFRTLGIVEDSKVNGVINESKQGKTGDCWLLAGINALSYTEEGAQIIKDSIAVNNDGSITVNLKGAGKNGKSYTFSQKDLNNKKYSKGDDDMLALEMAVETYFDELRSGKEVNYRNYGFNDSEDERSINGGYEYDAFELLTGKAANYTSDNDKINNILNSNKDYALAVNFAPPNVNDLTVKDIDGKTINIVLSHAYSIQSVNGDTVKLVNPWNSTKPVIITRDTFAKLGTVLTYSDLAA